MRWPRFEAVGGDGDHSGDPRFGVHDPSLPVTGYATHYGSQFDGQSLGCGAGVYSSADPSIIAVGPAHYLDWPCGASLRVCGPGGCLVGTRQDSCPGCGPNVVDLSEAGIALTCGSGANICEVTIDVVPTATDLSSRTSLDIP